MLLAVSGLLFWCVVGLPWAPHNESFDWIVRLEQRSLWAALFEKFPSVLSLRPLGTGPAWILYRLGGHDVALAEAVNAALALLAWAWVAAGARQVRLHAALALVAGGVFFAGYIWVFQLHGIFYGPLLLCLAALVRAARGPLDVRALVAAFLGAAVTALAHPYSLVLAVAFAAGAMIEAPALRQRTGWLAFAIVVSGAVAVDLALVPLGALRHSAPMLRGWVTSFGTLEVNRIGQAVAALLAVWTASRVWPGRAGAMAALVTLAVAAGCTRTGWPVLPLWILWAACKCGRRGHWALAALVVATLLLPLPNPTGSPTYAIFAVFAGVAATALDETAAEAALRGVPAPVGAALAGLVLAIALAVRTGIDVPVVSRLASPLLAEGERTRQFAVLVDSLERSPWRPAPARFLHPADDPSAMDALDRRYRAPTNGHHLETWLDFRRGGPATGTDTLLITFGGESVPGAAPLFTVHGRYAGDALVFRRIARTQ